VLFIYSVFPSYMFQSQDNPAGRHSVTPKIHYIVYHILKCWFYDIYNLKAFSLPSFLLLISLHEDGSIDRNV